MRSVGIYNKSTRTLILDLWASKSMGNSPLRYKLCILLQYSIIFNTYYVIFIIIAQIQICGGRYNFNMLHTTVERMLWILIQWVSGVHFTIHQFSFPLSGGCVSGLECQYIANVCLTDGCPTDRKHSINH